MRLISISFLVPALIITYFSEGHGQTIGPENIWDLESAFSDPVSDYLYNNKSSIPSDTLWVYDMLTEEDQLDQSDRPDYIFTLNRKNEIVLKEDLRNGKYIRWRYQKGRLIERKVYSQKGDFSVTTRYTYERGNIVRRYFSSLNSGKEKQFVISYHWEAGRFKYALKTVDGFTDTICLMEYLGDSIIQYGPIKSYSYSKVFNGVYLVKEHPESRDRVRIIYSLDESNLPSKRTTYFYSDGMWHLTNEKTWVNQGKNLWKVLRYYDGHTDDDVFYYTGEVLTKYVRFEDDKFSDGQLFYFKE